MCNQGKLLCYYELFTIIWFLIWTIKAYNILHRSLILMEVYQYDWENKDVTRTIYGMCSPFSVGQARSSLQHIQFYWYLMLCADICCNMSDIWCDVPDIRHEMMTYMTSVVMYLISFVNLYRDGRQQKDATGPYGQTSHLSRSPTGRQTVWNWRRCKF